eukprot:GHUV01005531.1.p1 GENE.GHUV01005531.1~~GHUV01005531.1.p1  ORF type:complete len:122 (+),score=43.11 GHUV01005531.1:285-650(+)
MQPSNPQHNQQQGSGSRSTTPPPEGLFIDAITERHISTDPARLLQRRCLTHSKQYGWTYDVWIDNPARYALTGANSRFSLPAIGQRIANVVTGSAAAAQQQMQQMAGALQQLQQRQHSQQR